MRVLNPGPGEIIDRLTVVARKIVEGGERAKHFEEEQEELHAALAQTWEFLNEDSEISIVFKDLFMLAATNAAIWQKEDELRTRRRKGVYSDETGAEVLAFRIQELNDQRAKLVSDINAAAGIVREEKLG
jgi:hypothetical protein